MRYVDNPPDPRSLMLTARSFGNYDLPSALADLIDNSIHAGSRRVDIDCVLADDGPMVRIRDDGHGMDEDSLVRAMRPASADPTADRDAGDLGRFGWGLKSASFSQCTELTVLSRTGPEACCGARWDLEAIDGWRMAVLEPAEIESLASTRLDEGSGTEVLWRKCDRLGEEGSLDAGGFERIVAEAGRRLALVFHKFLAGETPHRRLSLFLNGQELEGIDPFCRDHDATFMREVETLALSAGTVVVRPWTLPHFGRLTQAQQRELGGEGGFIRNQGFYVYRGGRLVISGTWFGLQPHTELSQLLRVEVEIPNSLDNDWKITVDKSAAHLPGPLRKRLQQLVQGWRSGSRRVMASRGGRLTRSGRTVVWEMTQRHGEVRYRINRRHPLVSAAQQGGPDQQSAAVDAALSLVEQGLPLEDMLSTARTTDVVIGQAARRADAITALLHTLVAAYRRAGTDEDGLLEQILETEPFSDHKELVRDWFQRNATP